MSDLVVFNPVKVDLVAALPSLKLITKINNELEATTASLGLKQVSACIKAVDDLRKTVKQPHIDAGKAIDEYAKNLVADAIMVQGQLKRVMLDWSATETRRKEEERRRLEEAKRAEDERRRIEAERDVTPVISSSNDDFDAMLLDDQPPAAVQARQAIIKEANLEAEQFVADKAHAAAVKQLDKKAVKGVRKVWRFAISDATKIPRQYLTIDQPTVNEAIRTGVRDIPGLRIFEEEIMAAR